MKFSSLAAATALVAGSVVAADIDPIVIKVGGRPALISSRLRGLLILGDGRRAECGLTLDIATIGKQVFLQVKWH